MVTWVAVVTLSVDLGLAVGVVFSMMTVVCRTQRWEKRRGKSRCGEARQWSAWGDFPARPGWESDPCFLPRVQCLALGLAEGTELYRPLRERHKVG